MGQTERIYFANVRDTDRPANLSIFPDYPRKIGSYGGVLDRAIKLLEKGCNRVYALIDIDKIIDERKVAEYYQAKLMAENKGILTGYDKSEKYLASSKLYEKYKQLLVNKAIPNAKRLENRRAATATLERKHFTFLNGILKTIRSYFYQTVQYEQ